MNDYPKDPRSIHNCRVFMSHYETVGLSVENQKEVAIEYFCKKFGLNPQYSIEDGNVVHCYEAATSHRFNVRDIIRKATAEDHLLYDMLRKLKDEERLEFFSDKNVKNLGYWKHREGTRETIHLPTDVDDNDNYVVSINGGGWHRYKKAGQRLFHEANTIEIGLLTDSP